MKSFLLAFIVLLLLHACVGNDPAPKFAYEANPAYTGGYVEFFGPYYAEYKNNNNVISLSIWSDSLHVNDQETLVGFGQFLSIEDIFVSPTSHFLPAGIYRASESGEAFTFYPGKKIEVDAMSINTGAFIYYFEKIVKYDIQKYIANGSFEVSIAEGKHTIKCNFTLADSTKITGVYSDSLLHFDQSTIPAGATRTKLKLQTR
ncbi:MAG: hypothetical protein AUK44_08080 [Porphyromonadaceae bacterium CG2_30_38_12]|nr:MAG: hypothetical protein AUK44_08080 [Porphyromonadaceae bacterium CG2_30_38_12]